MCGICGKLNFDREAHVSPAVIRAMADSIAHRGPDDDGYYCHNAVGLGFRRLSIIDITTGHQPICNEDGTIWIIFNGEIYNYRDLRCHLEARGHHLRSNTDTEVIVHLYEDLGVDCLARLRGMFAFAIWDTKRDTLFMARDRVGIKPLYYWVSERGISFASEIKALLADPDVHPDIIPEMIDRFLAFYYVPGNETLLRNIYKLPPGSYMTVSRGTVSVKRYWSLKFTCSPWNVRSAEERLRELLDECVQMHMISDVPVGFLLSGGVDSTAMLGIAAGNSHRSLNSFTLGFRAPGLVDERPYARLAAERFGSTHYELSIGAREFAEFLPRLAWHMEEPVCEPQAVALYYVTRLASRYVKVLISGEGGDEAFAGYPIYRNLLWLERFKSAFSPLCGVLSSVAARLNEVHPNHRLSKYGPLLTLPFGASYFSRTSSPSRYFNAHGADLYTADYYRLVDRKFSLAPINRIMNDGAACGVLDQMLYADINTSLPDDLLLKADKMTMANSVELRVPFLDHEFMEFAASLPDSLKVRGVTTKYIAKRALQKTVPAEILKRKKVGFPIPYDSWMRHELKDWVRDILLDRRTIERGYFRRHAIEGLIEQDRRHHSFPKELLSLLSLELWHRSFDSSSAHTIPQMRCAAVTAEHIG